MRSVIRAVASVGVTAALIGTWAAPAGAVTQTPVRATDANEFQPGAGGGFLAWEESVGEGYDIRVKPPHGGIFTVDAAGTNGAMGSIDGDRLVYQQFKGSTSDIKFFDLKSKQRSNPPSGVNTDKWEYWPKVDGDLLLFARQYPATKKRELVLFDLAEKTSTILATTTGGKSSIQPGQVNGNFVTWGTSDADSCSVFVRDLEAEKTTKVPNPKAKCLFGSSVSNDGTVYYGLSGIGCGTSSHIMRYPVGGPVATLVTFPEGVDFGTSFTLDRGAGKVSVYYDRTDCDPVQGDIYRIAD
jgi:hypothetical protein